MPCEKEIKMENKYEKFGHRLLLALSVSAFFVYTFFLYAPLKLYIENKDVLSRLDIKVFVDTDPDVRILRRIIRDVKERGRTLDSVAMQYLGTVKPMHEPQCVPLTRLTESG